MEDEFDFADSWELIYKKRKKIIKLTLLIVLIALAVSLIMPKTYESESAIQLAEIPAADSASSQLLFQPYQIKEFIESSTVLQPAIEKVFSDKDKPSLEGFKKSIEVEITQGLTDRWGNPTTFTSSYVTITASANDAEKSREINSAIIDALFDYANKEFERQKSLITEEHDKRVEGIEMEIEEREANIKGLESDVAALEIQINSINLNGEALAQTTLMRAIADSYKQRLLSEKNARIALKQWITNENIDFENELAGFKEFKIISEPQIPLIHSKPSIKINLLIALISGLILSIASIFLQEAVRK